MEKLKFLLFSVITLGILGLLGYWAVITLQSGDEYVREKKIGQLEKENQNLKNEIEELTAELSVLKPKAEEPAPATPRDPEPTVLKYQSLIDELEKLKSGNVFLKVKSRGPSVGTVQRFLNVYNGTSSKVDNDYGASVKAAVMAFQKAVGLSADGEAGPGTFTKMIEWLQKQG